MGHNKSSVYIIISKLIAKIIINMLIKENKKYLITQKNIRNEKKRNDG